MDEKSREIFHSFLTVNGWVVTLDGKQMSHHNTQAESEAAAIVAAYGAYERGGLGKAVLHESDGWIREERSYGKGSKGKSG